MKYTILINQFAAIRSGLDLDLIDLCIFDFIKDFSNSQTCVKLQTPQGPYFWISHSLVIESMPLLNIKTKQGIIKRIDNLVNAGLLVKHPQCDMYSKTLYQFGANYELLTFTPEADTLKPEFTPLNESLRGGIQKFRGPVNESLGDNNIIYNNNKYNNGEPKNKFSGSLFQELEKEKAKKTLFSNSEVYKLVEFSENGNDYSKFEQLYNTQEFETVDLIYYFHCVADWSDQKNMLRTKKGWIATVRNFIRADIERNKLHVKPENRSEKSKINASGAMDYLKGDY